MRRFAASAACNAIFATPVALLTACGQPTGTPGDAGAVATDAPAREVTTHTVEIERVGVVRGDEATVCINVPSGLAERALLVGVRTHLTEGSHHLIVSRASAPTASGTPFLCEPFRHGLGDTIFIAQQAEAGFAYPEGSGLVLEADQAIGLELHFINYLSDAPVDIAGTVELDVVPLPERYREVRIAFQGAFSLELPPHMETTERYTYTPGEGTEILALTSHTHQLGILSTIDLVTPEGTRRVHESRSWADPPLDVLSPPLVIGPDDSLELRCTYSNTTDRTVYFGEGFEDEMCFLWAYYLRPI